MRIIIPILGAMFSLLGVNQQWVETDAMKRSLGPRYETHDDAARAAIAAYEAQHGPSCVALDPDDVADCCREERCNELLTPEELAALTDP